MPVKPTTFVKIQPAKSKLALRSVTALPSLYTRWRSATNLPTAFTNLPIVPDNVPNAFTNLPFVAANVPIASTNSPFVAANVPIASTNSPFVAANVSIAFINLPIVAANVPTLSANPRLNCTTGSIFITYQPLSTVTSPATFIRPGYSPTINLYPGKAGIHI